MLTVASIGLICLVFYLCGVKKKELRHDFRVNTVPARSLHGFTVKVLLTNSKLIVMLRSFHILYLSI